MVIEWLKFKVEPQAREKFIAIDRQIWTPSLAENKGFLGKEIWIAPDKPDEVTLVIKWQTREAWKSVPADRLAETEAQFKAAMGGDRYQMTEVGEYAVRKFSEISAISQP
jgi:uncharacterized protein (TIGR03792 family)